MFRAAIKAHAKASQNQVNEVKKVNTDNTEIVSSFSSEKIDEPKIQDSKKTFLTSSTSTSNLWDTQEKTLHQILGQDDAKRSILLWLQNPTRPALLAGPSGCGKTVLSRAVLSDYKIWDESMLGEESLADSIAILSSRPSLLGYKRAAIIECAEGIATEDRTKLIKILKQKQLAFPIIITCDDPWDPSLRSLKECCSLIHMRKLNHAVCVQLLQSSTKQPLSTTSAESILEASQGNLRQAINSMQFLIQTKKRVRDGGETEISEMDKAWNMFEDSAKICSGQKLDVIGDSEMTIMMLHHNGIGGSRNISTASTMLDALSLTDLLEYETSLKNEIAVSAVSTSCSGPQSTPRMQFPSYFGKMSTRNSRDGKIRKAGAGLLYLGKVLKHTDSSIYPLENNTVLEQIKPEIIAAYDRLRVLNAKCSSIEGSGKKAKELQKSGLWIEGDACDFMRKSNFEVK